MTKSWIMGYENPPQVNTEHTAAAAKAALLIQQALQGDHQAPRNGQQDRYLSIVPHSDENWLLTAAGDLAAARLPGGLPVGEALNMQLEVLGKLLSKDAELLELQVIRWQLMMHQAPELAAGNPSEGPRNSEDQQALRKWRHQQMGYQDKQEAWKIIHFDLWAPLQNITSLWSSWSLWRNWNTEVDFRGLEQQAQLYTQVKALEKGEENPPTMSELNDVDIPRMIHSHPAGRWQPKQELQLNWGPWAGGKTLIVASVNGKTHHIIAWMVNT